MGALGNIISGLFGGKAPEAAKEPKKEAIKEVAAEATNNEHSQIATELAKPEVAKDSSRDPIAFIKNVSPKTEEKFATFDVKKFFDKLQTLNIGTEAKEYLEYGVDLKTVTTYELFQSTMRELQAKLPKSDVKPDEITEAQTEELKSLEKELEGLASLLGGLENASAEAKAEDKKTEDKKSEENKPMPAKDSSQELDKLLSTLTNTQQAA